MPLFNWEAPSAGQVVTPHFWVYWAAAGPLTLFVLGIVGAYAFYQSRKNDLAAKKARDSTKLKEV